MRLLIFAVRAVFLFCAMIFVVLLAGVVLTVGGILYFLVSGRRPRVQVYRGAQPQYSPTMKDVTPVDFKMEALPSSNQ